MERALGVTQPVLTHISHIGTPRPERGHILNPGSHQKQGVKALREPQKAQEAGAAELDKSPMAMYSGRLPGGGNRHQPSVEEQGPILAKREQRRRAIAYKGFISHSPRVGHDMG